MNKLLKPFLALVLVVLVCTVVIRTLTGAETLADYAASASAPASSQTSETGMTGASPAQTPLPSKPQTAPSPQTTGLPDKTVPKVPAGSPAVFSGPAAHQDIYQPGFYQEPLSEHLIAYISGISFPISAEEADALAGLGDSGPMVNIVKDISTIAISYDELRHLVVLYYDFQGEVQEGELICNTSIAHDLLEIFYELYQNKYPLANIQLIENYEGDDTLSMLANNTSAFNYRLVQGTSTLSKHALGRAIDINPFFNPYVVFQKDGSTAISPKGSEPYTDRSQNFPHKIDKNDLCYQLFKDHGFTWGGDWNTMKDYQHFQK